MVRHTRYYEMGIKTKGWALSEIKQVIRYSWRTERQKSLMNIRDFSGASLRRSLTCFQKKAKSPPLCFTLYLSHNALYAMSFLASQNEVLMEFGQKSYETIPFVL